MVKPRDNRIPIMMSDEELTAVDDWRFANRVATRSDSIRRLCKAGLSLNASAREIVAALDDAAMRLTDEEALEPLYRALAPVLLAQLGINSMKDLSIEMQESPAVARFYELLSDEEKLGDGA